VRVIWHVRIHCRYRLDLSSSQFLKPSNIEHMLSQRVVLATREWTCTRRAEVQGICVASQQLAQLC
jgi:hypothetical protein